MDSGFQELSMLYQAFQEIEEGTCDVTVANATFLPPFQSRRVKLRIGRNIDAREGYLSFIKPYQKHKQLVFQDGVIENKKYVTIIVSNKSHEQFYLEKFEKIGTFERVNILPVEKINQVQLLNESLRNKVEEMIETKTLNGNQRSEQPTYSQNFKIASTGQGKSFWQVKLNTPPSDLRL